MNRIEQRIQDGKLIIEDGRMMSEQQNGRFAQIGHPINKRGNLVIKYADDEGVIQYMQGTRVAWRILHGQWPPDDMSVVIVNKVKGDYRRDNLMLVPRGKENTALHKLRQMEAEAQPLVKDR